MTWWEAQLSLQVLAEVSLGAAVRGETYAAKAVEDQLAQAAISAITREH